ncbi:MAG TPA: hypothetical protein VEL10_11900 [Gaiellaceae bacterium]|nr:hypothetical protein [Gaiellaceae bacterium]
MIRALTVGAALVSTLATASSAQASAPNYILVSGPGLVRPVLLKVLTIFKRHGIPIRL